MYISPHGRRTDRGERTSTYVDVRGRTSAYVDVRRRASTYVLKLILSRLVRPRRGALTLAIVDELWQGSCQWLPNPEGCGENKKTNATG